MAAKRTCDPALAEPTHPRQSAGPHPGAGHLPHAANGGVARQQARERLGFTPSAGVSHAGDAAAGDDGLLGSTARKGAAAVDVARLNRRRPPF